MKNSPKLNADTHAREAAAEWVALDALKPWANNPRKNAAAIAPVVDSIKRFGFAAPILARREDGEIIAGHTRYAAAKKLGLDRVPVRYLDLEPADAHLLALADNRLGELATWDDATLAELLGPLMMERRDAAEVAGWTDDDIAALLKKNADAILDAMPAPAQLDGLEYRVVVDCRDEAHQAEVLARLEAEGLSCRPLIS